MDRREFITLLGGAAERARRRMAEMYDPLRTMRERKK
jgi:hypothetical protein